VKKKRFSCLQKLTNSLQHSEEERDLIAYKKPTNSLQQCRQFKEETRSTLRLTSTETILTMISSTMPTTMATTKTPLEPPGSPEEPLEPPGPLQEAHGPTSFNLRVEQNKIPEFFSSKSKDTISAADFIRRLEDLAKTNRWMDAQTYYHFANSLRNPA
jgi:hypothetical protein